jgi:hypothetical protein
MGNGNLDCWLFVVRCLPVFLQPTVYSLLPPLPLEAFFPVLPKIPVVLADIYGAAETGITDEPIPNPKPRNRQEL